MINCALPTKLITYKLFHEIVSLAGTMMKTSAKGSARSFAVNKIKFQQIELRSNQRYDALLNLRHYHQQQLNTFDKLSKQQRKIIEEQYAAKEKGILGECTLRSLFCCDVGTSFMADSLHNVYAGAFVSKIFKIGVLLYLYFMK
jgi:hypothetical protein